ncbi:MAG: tetratricopeptide repeat protein [Desulfobacterales bacterium]|nr:tetratricopeptide repeat protein [Desulfobacterales bacterium]
MIKDFSEAIVFYQQAIAQGLKKPYSSKVRYQTAEMLSYTKQYEEACLIYKELLEEYPNNRVLQFALARVLTWNNQFEEAVIEYKKILGEYHENHYH